MTIEFTKSMYHNHSWQTPLGLYSVYKNSGQWHCMVEKSYTAYKFGTGYDTIGKAQAECVKHYSAKLQLCIQFAREHKIPFNDRPIAGGVHV